MPQTPQNNKPISLDVTKEKLLEQAKREILYEEMDWEPMDDEKITLEVLLLQLEFKKKLLIIRIL